MKHMVVVFLSAGVVALGANGAAGQDYPSKPVRFVVGSPGSTSDTIVRLLLQGGLSSFLGQPVVVDNRSGAGSEEAVLKAPPDGYMVLIGGSSLWFAPLLRPMSYDPATDFAPVTSVASVPSILAVHPAFPVKSVKELIALAKARPGELNVATGNLGSVSHLAAELFKAMAGIKMVSVPYKTNAMQAADLMAGQTQLTIEGATATMPHVKSGKLRALAVASGKPSTLAPGLPTIAASGLPGYEFGQTQGIYAPGKTPAPIIRRLNQDTVRVLSQPEVKQRFFDVGQESEGSSAEAFGAKMKSDTARLGKVIKDAGIRID